jgi:choline kinase
MRHALAVRPVRGMALRFAENAQFQLGNARSLWAARETVQAPFVLAMADHIIDPAIVQALVRDAGQRSRLAVDRAAPGDLRADEATRAEVRDGRVLALGKSLLRWNALDTGTFWCTQAALDALTPQNRNGELADVFAALAGNGQLDAVDVTGRAWIDIDTAADLRRAEAMFGADGRVA